MALAVRSQFAAVVAANRPLCREHYLLDLTLPDFPPTSPGQFIQIACRDLDEEELSYPEHDWSPAALAQATNPDLLAARALLRRPFSLAGRSDEADGVHIAIIHRVVGVGTDWLSRLTHGDTVGILGPLGNRFTLPPRDCPAILVGGGVGIPPMLYLAKALADQRAVAICGVTTRDLLPLTILPDGECPEFGIPTIITTDDGSLGRRGFVTAALESHLDSLPRGDWPIIYTCGPEPMMKRVAEIAIARGFQCQIAVERAMACGMGTCQSCCIRVRVPMRPDGRDWVYRLACTDGPIFLASDLLW
jgi:dihydroorotate dehydrogenase electron transfer subunit